MTIGRFGVWMVRGYQRLISRYTPPSCRFYPSCSQYTLVSLARHGLFRGIVLGAWRIIRCNPWNPGGIDPVPQHFVLSCRSSGTKVEFRGGDGG